MSDQVSIIIEVVVGLILLGLAFYLLVDYKPWDNYKYNLGGATLLLPAAIILMFFGYLIK